MPAHKGHDKTGKYWQFGPTGKRYYYHSKLSEESAYKKMLKQARAIEVSKHGGFLESDARGPKAFRNWVEKYQNTKIIRLLVGRKPIFPIIEKIANYVSSGKYEDVKKKYNIEQLFHLYLFMELENGEGWIIQKNQVLDASQERPSQDSGLMGVNIPNDLTVVKLIHPAEQAMGSLFASYDAYTNNCQDWIRNILQGAGLLTPELATFIKQDTNEIANTIPAVAQFFSKAAIGLARKIDTLLHGSGNLPSLYLSQMLKNLN